jgi:hypothetical protein
LQPVHATFHAKKSAIIFQKINSVFTKILDMVPEALLAVSMVEVGTKGCIRNSYIWIETDAAFTHFSQNRCNFWWWWR